MEYLNVAGEHAAVDTETGEILTLTNPDVPLEQKIDLYAIVMDTLDAQIEVHKKYVSKHKDKIERILLEQERVKDSIKQQMQEQGLRNMKTPETTLYLQSKKKTLYDIETIPIEHCLAEIKGLLSGEDATSIVNSFWRNELKAVKKKIKEDSLETLFQKGLATNVVEDSLCRR